ncbi:MAG: hypothetical protein SynsKO_08470 [Synoicihabitans sp.]
MIFGSNHPPYPIRSRSGSSTGLSRVRLRLFSVRRVLLVLGCFVVATGVQAKLVFEATEVDVAVEMGAAEVWIEFPFKNQGSESVTVDNIHATCGCTVPELAKKEYAAGEEGVLRAQFTIGTRQGMQTKQITVQAGGESIALKFNASIPTRSQFAPRLLLFRDGDITPQSTTLTFSADHPVTVISVMSHNPTYQAELIPVIEGEKYEIKVSLTSRPDSDLRGTLRVRSEGASGQEYNDVFFARYLP